MYPTKIYHSIFLSLFAFSGAFNPTMRPWGCLKVRSASTKFSMSAVPIENSETKVREKSIPNVRDSLQTPYFIDVKEITKETSAASTIKATALDPPKPLKKLNVKKATSKRGGANSHKEGVFSPLVFLAKKVVGNNELNKLRGRVISIHSDVIGAFVETSESEFGQAVLRQMFQLADRDGNGKLDEEELMMALNALGFDWLRAKHVAGIVQRADANENGVIEYDEFREAAPKTLRTNLIKMAKKNGGEMGLLV